MKDMKQIFIVCITIIFIIYGHHQYSHSKFPLLSAIVVIIMWLIGILLIINFKKIIKR